MSDRRNSSVAGCFRAKINIICELILFSLPPNLCNEPHPRWIMEKAGNPLNEKIGERSQSTSKNHFLNIKTIVI